MNFFWKKKFLEIFHIKKKNFEIFEIFHSKLSIQSSIKVLMSFYNISSCLHVSGSMEPPKYVKTLTFFPSWSAFFCECEFTIFDALFPPMKFLGHADPVLLRKFF